MKVIPPLPILDTMLISSTATEPTTGETAYNAGTTYGLGDTCSVITTNSHLMYQSAIAGNIGNTPLTSPTQWVLIGTTNKMKMFDLLRNTATTVASPLTVVLTPGQRVNSLGLLGLVADSVTVSMTSVGAGGITVFTRTTNLVTRAVFNWYDYFFAPFTTRESVVIFDLPPYSDGVITITLTRASGNVSCGGLVLGNSVDLGRAQYNAVSDVLNFSTVTRDGYGNTTLVPRRNVPKTNQKVECDKIYVNRVRDVRDLLNASPALWSGLDDTTDDYAEALLILGVYKKFTISLDFPDMASIDLELEEV